MDPNTSPLFTLTEGVFDEDLETRHPPPPSEIRPREPLRKEPREKPVSKGQEMSPSRGRPGGGGRGTQGNRCPR